MQLLTTYFTDDSGEELELLSDGASFILRHKDSTVFRALTEDSCDWAADNLIYAANNSEYTLSQVLTLIITGTWGKLEVLDGFDTKLLRLLHMYVNKAQLSTS